MSCCLDETLNLIVFYRLACLPLYSPVLIKERVNNIWEYNPAIDVDWRNASLRTIMVNRYLISSGWLKGVEGAKLLDGEVFSVDPALPHFATLCTCKETRWPEHVTMIYHNTVQIALFIFLKRWIFDDVNRQLNVRQRITWEKLKYKKNRPLLLL